MFKRKKAKWYLVCCGVMGAACLMSAHAFSAQNKPVSSSHAGTSEMPYCSPEVDIAATFLGGPHEDPDVRRVSNEIDSTFKSALKKLKSSPPKDFYNRIMLLGKLELYDKNLSVNRNIACTTCHDQAAGFTGGVDLYNRTIVAHPGSVHITNAPKGKPNWRISNRKPPSYGYAAFSPVLHYNATQGDFYGGNFWDMRATGLRMGNPASAQAKAPPLNPLEMGFADAACVVHRLSQSPYRDLFEQLWGEQSFAIKWPADIEEVCSRPAPAPANDPYPVHLDPVARGIVNETYDNAVMAIGAYEAGPEASPFSSKFDYALAHPDKQVLSPDELAGWELFRTKGKCNTCHLDGTQNTPMAHGQKKSQGGIMIADAADLAPLFTDFTSSNLGLPKNKALPFYCEDTPDQYGFVANPAGRDLVDRGVGDVLKTDKNINPEWAQYADQFMGKFKVPTLRNVDKRPRPDFVKAYMHNGYLKSLKEVVHFYNTRDKLPNCPQGSPGEKETCWPPPEVSKNLDKTVGNLGLTDKEEDQIVAFMKTLTDGYSGKGY